MAMRARVELKGCLTHDAGGRHFAKGQPQILTNPAEIKYYQGQAEFSVTMLDVAKSKKKAIESEREAERKSQVEGDDVDDDNDDDVEDDDDDDDGEDGEGYTREDLKGYKKNDLKEIAAELGLDVGGTVKELIDRIVDRG